MQTESIHKLNKIREVSIYGAKFHKLPPVKRLAVLERLGDKINADTLAAAIKAEKSK